MEVLETLEARETSEVRETEASVEADLAAAAGRDPSEMTGRVQYFAV